MENVYYYEYKYNSYYEKRKSEAEMSLSDIKRRDPIYFAINSLELKKEQDDKEWREGLKH